MGRPRKKLPKPDIVDDENLCVYQVELSQIHYDSEFNCRNEVLYETVLDLAASVKEHGLAQPILLWEREGLPDDKVYQVLAGHRRFRAFEYLKRETIPAFIRVGLTEREAAIINLEENLERSDPPSGNRACNAFASSTTLRSLRTISQEIRKSERWIQTRQRVLEFPTEIQHMLVAGRVPLQLVTEVWNVFKSNGPAAAVKACREIEKAREGRVIKRSKLPAYLQSGHPRPPKDKILEKVSTLLAAKLTGLAPRFGAYCAGYVSEEDIIKDIEAELKSSASITGLQKRIRSLEKKVKELNERLH